MKFDVVRAWKDAQYRQSLSAQEQAVLPGNPAGGLDLSDAELQAVHGACHGRHHHPAHHHDHSTSYYFYVNSNVQISLLGGISGLCMNSAASILSCNSNSFSC